MIERADKLNNQAIILASDGDYSSAIACFRRALILEQTNYLLWFNLGVTYRDSGDLEQAENSLEKAFFLAPENEEVLETYATLCLENNKLTKAFELCIQGLDLNNENSHFWNLMGVIFFKKEAYDDASEHFEIAVSLNPYYKDALYNLRDTYIELNNKVGIDECNKKLKNLK